MVVVVVVRLDFRRSLGSGVGSFPEQRLVIEPRDIWVKTKYLLKLTKSANQFTASVGFH